MPLTKPGDNAVPSESRRPAWQWHVALGLAVFVGLAFCLWGYQAPSTFAFYAGLVILLAGFGPLSFRLGRIAWPPILLRVNLSIFLMLTVFLIFELVWAVYERLPRDESWKHKVSYSYDEAISDIDGFRRWWNHSRQNFRASTYLERSENPSQPYVLTPGARGRVLESEVSINSLGFRGPEFKLAKGRHFRIIALGESTTFGATQRETDRPWPEVLEGMIERRLACNRPVQVINGGVPGWTLANQLSRLNDEILPLKPDMILSYHGFNGFHYFFSNLPEMLGEAITPIGPRPSRLLATVENGLQRRRTRERYRQASEFDEAAIAKKLEESPYAILYDKLGAFTRQHRIELVLSTFNMAVNADSPDVAIQLYEETFPDLRGRIAANRLHNDLIRLLGTRPGISAVDTTDSLDGHFRDYFTDVVHFNQDGRERLAHVYFEALQPKLASNKKLRCRVKADAVISDSELSL